jgi:hypothetical protein
MMDHLMPVTLTETALAAAGLQCKHFQKILSTTFLAAGAL